MNLSWSLIDFLYILFFTILYTLYMFYLILYFDGIFLWSICKRELDVITLFAVKILLNVLAIGGPDDSLQM